MKTFAIFCSDDEGLADKLKSLASSKKLSKCALAIDNPAGPNGYNIAKDAYVTVLLYNRRRVVVNHAFRKGEFNEKAIQNVIADLPKILK